MTYRLSDEDRQVLRDRAYAYAVPAGRPSWEWDALVIAVEAIVAREVAAAKAEALREAAADLDQFAADTYPEDIFRRPTSGDYAEINALLKRERGHMLDGIAADCYSHAISVQAARLRERAAEIEGDES